MKTKENIVKGDLADFLEALLFVAESEDRPHVANWTIYQFHPEFTQAIDGFIDGFRDYVAEKRPDIDPDDCERPFGGNVFFSLSGHGCGFFDERDSDLADPLQKLIIEYSGNPYRFEELEHSLAKFKGQTHLSYRTAKSRRDFLKKLVWLGPDGDKRYTIALERNGQENVQWVVRWCGDYLRGFDSMDDAIALASEHREDRMKKLEPAATQD